MKRRNDPRINSVITAHPRTKVTLPLNVELPAADWERLAKCAQLSGWTIDRIAALLLEYHFDGDSCELLNHLQSGGRI